MAFHGDVLRWDIFWADLEPHVGGEQGGKRPVLVFSNDGFNAHFDLVTILPLTKRAGKTRRVYEFEAVVSAEMIGTTLDSIVMPQQIRTISKRRLGGRVGTLADERLRSEIEDRVLEHLGIDFIPDEL